MLGARVITGLFRARDIHMQRTRIRQSMRRVDPEGVLLRALEMNIIRRRHYSVAGPLSLWHIDGSHKLIWYDITSNEFYNVKCNGKCCMFTGNQNMNNSGRFINNGT